MKDMLADSNVILDLFTDDPAWGDWSESALDAHSATHLLCINPVVYSEISIGFARIEELEEAIGDAGFQLRPIPREALFLAGKAFLKYRRAGGHKATRIPWNE